MDIKSGIFLALSVSKSNDIDIFEKLQRLCDNDTSQKIEWTYRQDKLLFLTIRENQLYEILL